MGTVFSEAFHRILTNYPKKFVFLKFESDSMDSASDFYDAGVYSVFTCGIQEGEST